MSTIDRASRSELVQTVEDQREQLQRFESRLRNLLAAYKGLINEKEALENTVSALTSVGQRSSVGEDNKTSDDAAGGKPAVDGQAFSDPLNSQPDGHQAHELSRLNDKVSTLSSSIVTLTHEKSRLESSYLAEKKQLRQECEDLQRALEKEQTLNGETVNDLQEQLQELKSKIRKQHLEHEAEETDHAMMLRELQKLLADERMAKENAEHQLDESRARLKHKDEQPVIMTEHYEKRIRDLSNELQVMRNRMKLAEEKSNQPVPLLLELQREMADMKAQHRVQVLQEQKRANEAEDRVKLMDKQAEERVSSMEVRLSELSDVVGNYERIRFQDQQAIQRLKERVTQLDIENTALAQAVRSPDHDFLDPDDVNLDVNALASKIMQLKGLLRLANERSEKPISLHELSETGVLTTNECALCKRNQDNLAHVQEEFERYKLRAQSVLKSKNSKDSISAKEVDSYRTQVNELKDRLRSLHSQLEISQEEQKQRLDDMAKAMLNGQEKHKAELAHIHAEQRHEIGELETQLRKQRERTVALLSEKDRQLEHMRRISPGRASVEENTDGTQHVDHMISDDSDVFSGFASRGRHMSDGEEAVSQILHSTRSRNQGDVKFLHFAHEKARKDVEINTLRKQKKDLEQSMREMQFSRSACDEQYSDKVSHLEEEIRKHYRDKKREGANLEYLKNVTFRFLTCTDTIAKQQMLKAIATILEFSPLEKASMAAHTKGWWS